MAALAVICIGLTGVTRTDARPLEGPDPVNAEASAQATPDPWAPSTWLEARPVLQAVRPDDGGAAVELRFSTQSDPDAEIRRVHDGHRGERTVEIWLPNAGAEGIELGSGWSDAAPEVDARPDGITLSVTLRSDGPLALERTPDGWRLGPPDASRSPDQWTAGSWAQDADAAGAIEEVHRAMAEARRGHGPEALGRLLEVLHRPPPLALRPAIHLAMARLAMRERLMLIALGAAARAVHGATDARIRTGALAIMLEVERQRPTALSLVAPDIALALGSASTLDDAEALFAVAQALLRVDEPSRAALLARRAHRQWSLRLRARYLAHVAARLMGDRAAAEAHLDAILRAEAPPLLRAEALLARARLAYETGDDDAAETALRAAADLATREGDPSRLDAIDVVRGWSALRRGETVAALEALGPIDASRHSPARILLAGTVYLTLCHPARASALAGRLIDREVVLSPVEQQRRQEEATLARPRFAAVRALLQRRLDEHDSRISAINSLSPDEFYLRRALRLRSSADLHAGYEAYDRMDPDQARRMPPPESPSPDWRDGHWVDNAQIGDRCGGPFVKPPLSAPVASPAQGEVQPE